MRITVPVAGPLAKDSDIQVNDQRSINLYPEIELVGAKSQLTMKSTPGLNLITTAGNGPIRSNIVKFASNAYFVSGQQLMKMTTAYAVSAVGTLNTTSGWCGIVAGRSYVVVVDGGDLYTWDDSDFAIVTDSGDADYDAQAPTSATSIAYIDGYYVANNAATDDVIISALEDPQAWDATDFTSADAHPDDVKALMTTFKDIYAIGSETTQVYYNSGNADFPFDLYPNGVLEWGTPAFASVANAQGNVFMLGASKEGALCVVMISGFSVSRISDTDMDRELSGFTTYSDAVGMTYHQAGQTFYILTLPTEDRTFVYHVEQQMWHERTYYGGGRHRASGTGAFNGRIIVGDYSNNNIYYFDLSKYTDNGATIERKRITQCLHKDGLPISVSELFLEFAAGVGLTSGQGSDPQVVLRYSKNGGKTWSSAFTRDIGPLGEYDAAAVWHKLGQSERRGFVFEITVTDPVSVTLIGGYADVTVDG